MTAERYFTAADVAEAFQRGLELGQRGDLAPGTAAAYLDGYTDGQRAGLQATDGGFAERFLEDQRALTGDAADSAPVLHLVPDQVREVIDGDGPVPAGLDPESIAAARRIARRLNGGPR